MGKVITIDSLEPRLTEISERTKENRLVLEDIIRETEQNTQQSRIHNMYKAHENDFIIDPNIFENDNV